MLKDSLRKHTVGLNKEFRHRGEEPGRLENFSDAVFALAITLLLISTSPPSNFDQIKRFVWEVIPFCLCITAIILVWHEHFKFYFRYGIRNGGIIVLNTIFLIILLFYVYPLKFLAKLILLPIAIIIGHDKLIIELTEAYKGTNITYVMVIYGIGAMGVFLVLTLMYRFALRNSELLELNEIEKFDTRASIRANFLMATVPFVSVLVAVLFRNYVNGAMCAGFCYWLYPILMISFAKLTQKKRKKVLESAAESSENAT